MMLIVVILIQNLVLVVVNVNETLKQLYTCIILLFYVVIFIDIFAVVSIMCGKCSIYHYDKYDVLCFHL